MCVDEARARNTGNLPAARECGPAAADTVGRRHEEATSNHLRALADLHAHAISRDAHTCRAAVPCDDPQSSTFRIWIVDDLTSLVVHVDVGAEGCEKTRVIVPTNPAILWHLGLLDLGSGILGLGWREVVEQAALALFRVFDNTPQLGIIALDAAHHASVNQACEVGDCLVHRGAELFQHKLCLRKLFWPAVGRHGPWEAFAVFLGAGHVRQGVEVEGTLGEVGFVSQFFLAVGPTRVEHRVFILKFLQTLGR
mmetsp:Transcript_97854/g.281117  ORF Transcript_97854/g.281117 Transcript_97854/m.281117 type:complete len:253 (-) Transcript_97854:245-1003(-)